MRPAHYTLTSVVLRTFYCWEQTFRPRWVTHTQDTLYAVASALGTEEAQPLGTRRMSYFFATQLVPTLQRIIFIKCSSGHNKTYSIHTVRVKTNLYSRLVAQWVTWNSIIVTLCFEWKCYDSSQVEMCFNSAMVFLIIVKFSTLKLPFELLQSLVLCLCLTKPDLVMKYVVIVRKRSLNKLFKDSLSTSEVILAFERYKAKFLRCYLELFLGGGR
jgi:hypothetical protein